MISPSYDCCKFKFYSNLCGVSHASDAILLSLSVAAAQVDFLPILEERDKNGYTALHYAAKLGHIKTAERLLKLGTSITTKNNDGENVFHIACR